MSNIDAVNALITAIHFDRFAEIEARHDPDVVFASFRGPVVHGSVGVEDWQRNFLRDYADCNYTDVEYIEDGDVVVARATIEAKGYDWRQFTQRVLEVMRFADGLVAERRLYVMQPDIDLDKAALAAMKAAADARGGSPAESRKILEALKTAANSGDTEAAKALYHEKAVTIDGVYGSAAGYENMMALRNSRPRPAIGSERTIGAYYGPRDFVREAAVEPSRPRRAEWFRVADGKIVVAEVYWMLREIGVEPSPRKRHPREATYPI